jgi:periplasmic divalent cation tolerance protein
MSFVTVYITCKDKKEAAFISKSLLKERLIGCANILPSESMYWWKNKIKKQKEYVIFAKTHKKHQSTIINAVKRLHSYKVPCVNFLPVEIGNFDYANWLEKETRK